MTKVGKVLVFFNLLFSLAVGAFAVVDYSTRNALGGAAAFEGLEGTSKVLTTSRDLYRSEAEQGRAEDAKVERGPDAHGRQTGGPQAGRGGGLWAGLRTWSSRP